jgi:hypothetical protein
MWRGRHSLLLPDQTLLLGYPYVRQERRLFEEFGSIANADLVHPLASTLYNVVSSHNQTLKVSFFNQTLRDSAKLAALMTYYDRRQWYRQTSVGRGEPEARFNVYIHYSFDAFWHGDAGCDDYPPLQAAFAARAPSMYAGILTQIVWKDLCDVHWFDLECAAEDLGVIPKLVKNRIIRSNHT